MLSKMQKSFNVTQNLGFRLKQRKNMNILDSKKATVKSTVAFLLKYFVDYQ